MARIMKANYIPQAIRTMVAKGNIDGLIAEQKAIRKRICKMIGNEAMNNLGVGARTPISELLKLEEKVASYAHIRHALSQ